MGIYFQRDSLQTYRTAIEVGSRSDIWIIERGVTVLSETAYAIHADGYKYRVTVKNEGTLSSWQDYGVRLDGVSNWVLNNGTISGLGGVKAGAQSNVDNFGSIITYSDSRPAIDVDGRSGGSPVRISNAGTIEGVAAIRVKGGAAVQMTNDGTVTGLITLGKGDDSVVNHGMLHGEVSLGAGEDVFIGNSGGALIVDGGAGKDVIVGGAGADHLVGGRGKDRLFGGEGDDTIVGCYGKDVLEGGDGADTFVFANLKAPDRIKDFAIGEDRIHLDNAAMKALGSDGALAEDAFQVGPHATDDEHRIIYDEETGDLWYDKNGSDDGGVTKLAKLAPGLDLTHHHFEII